MYKISNEEIDFILNDIKMKGIQTEDLQYNLLDHICCLIENEMSENEDFHSFYKRIIPTFFKINLQELQTETNHLLQSKNYSSLKKMLKISGIGAVGLVGAGVLGKVADWQEANLFITFGAWLLGLFFLPAMILLKFRDEASPSDKWILSFGFILASVASLGISFKLMRWPYANALMYWSSLLFLGGYLPLYYLVRARKAELKFNTTIHAVLMMVFGGMLFSLSSSKEKDVLLQDIQISHIRLEKNIQSIQETNKNLYKTLKINNKFKDFQKITNSLFSKITVLKKHISISSSNQEKRMIEEDSLKTEMSRYNDFILSFFLKKSENQKLVYPNTQDVSPQIFLLNLTQIQLQILLNENLFLISQSQENQIFN